MQPRASYRPYLFIVAIALFAGIGNVWSQPSGDTVQPTADLFDGASDEIDYPRTDAADPFEGGAAADDAGFGGFGTLPKDPLGDGAGGFGFPSPGTGFGAKPITVSSSFSIDEDSRSGRLFIAVKLEKDWHIPSLTQEEYPLEVVLDPSKDFVIDGKWQSDHPPEVRKENWGTEDKPNIKVYEDFYDEVTFSVAIKLAAEVDPQSLEITGHLAGQMCKGETMCVALEPGGDHDTSFMALLVEGEEAEKLQEATEVKREFRPPNWPVVLRGHIEPKVAVPGETVSLVLSAEVEDGWQVYPYSPVPAEGGNSPTLIVLTSAANVKTSAPVPSSEPLSKKALDPSDPDVLYHAGDVSWTIELEIPKDAEPGEMVIGGLIGYQTCQGDTSCMPTVAAQFSARLPIKAAVEEGKLPLAFYKSTYKDVEAATRKYPALGPRRAEPITFAGLLRLIGFGLLGGLILNLMPCVLPVVGLKVMAFIEQGGQNRFRVFMLNVWYSLGLMAVFFVLATLAAWLGLAWGELFTFTWFKVSLAALVFVMALSFLGVWEIPIPGFVGSGKASELSSQEGIAGAFFKGVFTTILATPCSGPFLGPVFGFLLGQPPYIVYTLFMSIGFGMAAPYLLIGLFPGMIRFLPRPGMWMDTLKQVMGFVLLLTVVYLFYTISPDYFVPTLTLLIGLWFAAWLIGRTPFTATLAKKTAAWAGGIMVAAILGYFAFTYLVPGDTKLAWTPYNEAELTKQKEAGKTVMVDFTANWCLTCKWNLKNSIETKTVKALVEKNGVVPMLADWTDKSDSIKNKLAELGSNSIPVLAIYPADNPDEPIILRDALLESQVLEALEKAGPSKETAVTTAEKSE